jgi:hypothetical protein
MSSWPLRNERGSDDVAGVAPLPQRAVNDIAGAAGSCTHVALARRALEPPLEFEEIVGQSIDARGRLCVAGQDGDDDGLLVDVHPEMND